MNTLLLSRDLWDLCLDSAGNIAMASGPYAIAQDVSYAARLFLGELWYDTAEGIPYFETVLGHAPSIPFFKGLIRDTALAVPGVADAVVFISAIENRSLRGQIQITTTTGAKVNAGF